MKNIGAWFEIAVKNAEEKLDYTLDDLMATGKQKFVTPEKFFAFLKKTLIPILIDENADTGEYDLDDIIRETNYKILDFRHLHSIYFKHSITSGEWVSWDDLEKLSDKEKKNFYRIPNMMHKLDDGTVTRPEEYYIKRTKMDSDRCKEDLNDARDRMNYFRHAVKNLFIESFPPEDTLSPTDKINDLRLSCVISGERSVYLDLVEDYMTSDGFRDKPLAKTRLMIDLAKRLTAMEQVLGDGNNQFRKLFDKHVTKPHGLLIFSKHRHFGDHHYGETRDIGLLFNSQGIADLPPITLFSTQGGGFYSEYEHLPGLPTLHNPMAVPLSQDNSIYESLASWLLRSVTQSDNISGQYISMASGAYAQMNPKKHQKRPSAMGT